MNGSISNDFQLGSGVIFRVTREPEPTRLATEAVSVGSILLTASFQGTSNFRKFITNSKVKFNSGVLHVVPYVVCNKALFHGYTTFGN